MDVGEYFIGEAKKGASDRDVGWDSDPSFSSAGRANSIASQKLFLCVCVYVSNVC